MGERRWEVSRRVRVYIGGSAPTFIFTEGDMSMKVPSCYTQAERKLRKMGVKGWVKLVLMEGKGMVGSKEVWIGSGGGKRDEMVEMLVEFEEGEG